MGGFSEGSGGGGVPVVRDWIFTLRQESGHHVKHEH
jgi:hypothetical protein